MTPVEISTSAMIHPTVVTLATSHRCRSARIRRVASSAAPVLSDTTLSSLTGRLRMRLCGLHTPAVTTTNVTQRTHRRGQTSRYSQMPRLSQGLYIPVIQPAAVARTAPIYLGASPVRCEPYIALARLFLNECSDHRRSAKKGTREMGGYQTTRLARAAMLTNAQPSTSMLSSRGMPIAKNAPGQSGTPPAGLRMQKA